MASSRPRFPLPLQTGSLPGISESDLASTASPARGKEMRQNLLAKLRPPALVHSWDFWHDRQDRNKQQQQQQQPTQQTTAAATTGRGESTTQETYDESRLVRLHSVNDVREFWEVFNNLDISSLPLRDTIHLFHRGIRPVWEDARNERGGSWTFRVPKQHPQSTPQSQNQQAQQQQQQSQRQEWSLALEFWKHIALMAIGEQLQAAVADANRKVFLDDICGVSISIRFTSVLVQVWHRDAAHVAGRERILETVLGQLPDDLRPREGTYYYKAHVEHAGFRGVVAENGAAGSAAGSTAGGA